MTDRDAAKTPPWHAVAVDETIRRLKSDPAEGLARDEADRRLAKYGPNRLPEGSKRGPLMRFLLQFDNVLVYVLLAAGFIKLMLGLWLGASIITGEKQVRGRPLSLSRKAGAFSALLVTTNGTSCRRGSSDFFQPIFH